MYEASIVDLPRPEPFISPAKQLLGRDLPGGWKVIEQVTRTGNFTGGHFSEGYIVESIGGKRGFLKALDYSEALKAPDPARALQAMTASYIFERDLLNRCRARRLDRVALSIADGSVSIDPTNPAGTVQYLIFDLADGDVRQQLSISHHLTKAWSLRCLHHIATGLNQLHGQGIAHQDLKPSNVLVFQRDSKVGDLGRAACRSLQAPHDEARVAGDLSYAPPELLYGYVPNEWNDRRFGCDAYLLGSMAVFFFSGVGITSLIRLELHENQRWNLWVGSFEEVLPFVQGAFGRAIQSLKDSQSWPDEELTEIVQQLCEPDPTKRGHPQNRISRGNPYSLERYISRLDVVARRAELGLRAQKK